MIILATDTVMLGHLSKEALAAGALGNIVYFLVWLLGSGMPMAVSPVIAHVQGAHAGTGRDQREVRVAVRMGLWWVAMMSLPLLAVLIFTRPILIFFQQEAELASGAALFMAGVFPGMLLGPLFGAVLGEFLARRRLAHAGRVGIGTWLGLVAAAVVKVVIATLMVATFVAFYLLNPPA